MTSTKENTWKDLEDAVGQDFSDGEIHWGLEPIEITSIRRYCEVIETDFPFFHNLEEAQSYGYKNIICPISHIQNHMGQGLWRPGDSTRWPVSERNYWAHGEAQIQQQTLPTPKTSAVFATEREVEYFHPVYLGDRLGAKGRKLLSVNVRETSVGYGAFCVFETEWVNQEMKPIGFTRTGSYQYNPHPEGYKPNLPPSSTQINRHTTPFEVPEARASYKNWHEQRYYEDVEVGDFITPVTFHMTVQRLVYEAGGNRDFALIHHNDEVAQAGGASAMYANNGFLQGMWERVYREFFGLEGWIQKVGPFRIRRFTVVGKPVVVRGQVIGKWQEDGKNLVELEMWTENPDDVTVGPGSVIGTLPSRVS